MIQQVSAEGTPYRSAGQQKNRTVTALFAVLLTLAKTHAQHAAEGRGKKANISHDSAAPVTRTKTGKKTHASTLHTAITVSHRCTGSIITGKPQGSNADLDGERTDRKSEQGWHQESAVRKPTSTNLLAVPIETCMPRKQILAMQGKPLLTSDTHTGHPLSEKQTIPFLSNSRKKHVIDFSGEKPASVSTPHKRLFIPASGESATEKKHAFPFSGEWHRARHKRTIHSLAHTRPGDRYSPPEIHGQKWMDRKVRDILAKQVTGKEFHSLVTKNRTAENLQSSDFQSIPESQPAHLTTKTATKTKGAMPSRPIAWMQAPHKAHTFRSDSVAMATATGIPAEIQQLRTSSLHSERASYDVTLSHSIPVPTTTTGTSIIHPAATTEGLSQAAPSGTWTISAAMHEIGRVAGQGKIRLELRLEPKHLGKIRVFLDGDKHHGIQIHMIVDQSASRQAIEQHLPILKQALSQQGLSLGGFSMSSHHDQGNRNPSHQEQSTTPDHKHAVLSGEPPAETTTVQRPGDKVRLSIHI